MTADTYSNTLGYLIMGTGNDNNVWGGFANTAVFQIFEDAIANTLNSAVTGGTLDLSGTPPPAAASQVRYAHLTFSGTLGSNQIVQVPNLVKSWWVQNNTAGAFTLTFKTPSGTASLAIPQNAGWQRLYCNGSNNIFVSPFNSALVRMPDGGVSAPEYSNVNEPTSGLRRSGTQDWRFTVNGVDILQLTGTGAASPSIVNVLSPNALQVAGGGVIANGGVVKAADGTVSAPGLTFNSETGTGAYRIGAGDVGFAILGSRRWEVTANFFLWFGATFAGTDLSPTSFGTDQNNYNPANLATATCLRLNVTAYCQMTGLAGGGAAREIELQNAGSATLVLPANSGSSSAANRFANNMALFPGQTIILRYDDASSIWRPKNAALPNTSMMPASVSGDLLIVNNTGSPNTKIDVTCGQVVLNDSLGNAIKFSSVSVTIDLTTTGANGCDVGTRAASTQYYVWLISDGGTVAGIVSTSSSAPSLASAANYIYKKRVGATFTNGSSNLYSVKQLGQSASYTAALASLTSGTGTVNVRGTPGVAPSTASQINIVVSWATGQQGAISYDGNTPFATSGGNGAASGDFSGTVSLWVQPLTTLNIASLNAFRVLGWIDPV